MTTDFEVTVPQYMKEIVAEITRLARRSPDVNQRSGVSVRASIADYESLLANAMRRAIRLNEKEIVPRISDLPYVMPAISGKVELETVEEGKEGQILERLIQGAVLAVFNRHFDVVDLEDVVARFKDGLAVEVSDTMPARDYLPLLEKVEGLERAVAKLKVGEQPALIASAVEFVLEGLHLNKRLNKDKRARPRPVPRIACAPIATPSGTAPRKSHPSTPIASCQSITDDLMNFGDLQHALRNLLQRGMRNPRASASRACATCCKRSGSSAGAVARPLRPDLRPSRTSSSAWTRSCGWRRSTLRRRLRGGHRQLGGPGGRTASPSGRR